MKPIKIKRMAKKDCVITECSVLSNKKAPLKACRKLFALPVKKLSLDFFTQPLRKIKRAKLNMNLEEILNL